MKIPFYKAWIAGDWTDKVVAAWTFGPYSHCELMFSDGMCFSASWRDDAVRFKKIHLIPNRWDIVELPTTEEQERQIREWCEGQVNENGNYDWWGIVQFVIPFIRQKNEDWYCSEVCIAGLKSQGVVNYSNYNSPNHFYRLLKRDGYQPNS